MFRHYGFKGFRPHIVGSSGTRLLCRIRNTIVRMITPKLNRELNEPENSQVNLYQISEGRRFGQRGLGLSPSGGTDPPTEHDLEFAHETQTGVKYHAWPFTKIKGMIWGNKGPALADLTINTTLGIQIDQSLRRMGSEYTIESGGAHC